MNKYSVAQVSEELIKEVIDALKNIRGWGSVEIIVQDSIVVQINERNIRKTNNNLSAGKPIESKLNSTLSKLL